MRLTTGCSAGIVSGEGLVMTNNHCVSSCVQNISTPEVQYAETGVLEELGRRIAVDTHSFRKTMDELYRSAR